MKALKFVSTFLFLVSFGIFISCGNKSHEHNHDQMESTTDSAGKEYTSKYVCSMHCEGSGSEESGNCPKCGMAYVLNEDHQADGHRHDNGR